MPQARTTPEIDFTKPIGPQHMARFEQGDYVAHVMHGDGLVTSKTEHYIIVRFKGAEHKKYDAEWFAQYPTHLFHRTPHELRRA